MDSKAPGAARSSRAFGYVLASTIALFGISLPVSLWLYSRRVISGSDAFGIVVLGAGLVSLLVWASLLSRIRFTRR